MIKVGISAALERRIRDGEEVRGELIELIDKARNKPKVQGMGYKELLAAFRLHLGPGLALPPNPSAGWIVRQVARAKDLGLDAESIRRTCEGLKRLYPRGPWELEFVLRAAPRLISAVYEGCEEEGDVGKVSRVVSGRRDD